MHQYLLLFVALIFIQLAFTNETANNQDFKFTHIPTHNLTPEEIEYLEVKRIFENPDIEPVDAPVDIRLLHLFEENAPYFDGQGNWHPRAWQGPMPQWLEVFQKTHYRLFDYEDYMNHRLFDYKYKSFPQYKPEYYDKSKSYIKKKNQSRVIFAVLEVNYKDLTLMALQLGVWENQPWSEQGSLGGAVIQEKGDVWRTPHLTKPAKERTNKSPFYIHLVFSQPSLNNFLNSLDKIRENHYRYTPGETKVKITEPINNQELMISNDLSSNQADESTINPNLVKEDTANNLLQERVSSHELKIVQKEVIEETPFPWVTFIIMLITGLGVLIYLALKAKK